MAEDPFASIAQPNTATADPFSSIATPIQASAPSTPVTKDESGLPIMRSQTDATKYGISEAIKGVGDVAKGTLDLLNPIPHDTTEKVAAVMPGALPVVRAVKGLVEPLTHIGEVPGAIKDIAESPSALHALATVAPRAGGQGLGTLATSAAGKGLSKVGELRTRLAPREIPIAGERVPALAGEAAPETRTGRVQSALKRSGAGEQAFKDFSTKQQAAVKNVIRKVAQQTSGAVGPMADEPGTAMSNAADATFAKARPMYEALDSALVTVPDAMSEVSKVTEQAIARATKLGANVTRGAGESVTIDGRKFTPGTDPQAWANLKQQGLVPDTAGQPLSTYMKVRSELLKMQRATPDAALRNAIGNEVSAMNENMEAALKGTPLYDDWTEANRLWSKGYAIRDVGDAIRKSTKGTPASQQAEGLSKVPTTIKGGMLVTRLNELQQNGVLQRAFTPQEVANLRQAADILDRASAKPGAQFGYGYGVHSSIWRNIVKLPAYPLVKAMTSTEGVRALQAGDAGAFSALVSAGQASQVKNRKDAIELLRPTAQ